MSTPLVELGAGPFLGAGTSTTVLAQDPAPPPGEGPEFGKASPVALVVIVLLGLATVLLIRSMTKHIKRVPASFDDPPTTEGVESAPPVDDAARAEPAVVEPGEEPELTPGKKVDPPARST